MLEEKKKMDRLNKMKKEMEEDGTNSSKGTIKKSTKKNDNNFLDNWKIE